MRNFLFYKCFFKIVKFCDFVVWDIDVIYFDKGELICKLVCFKWDFEIFDNYLILILFDEFVYKIFWILLFDYSSVNIF